MKVCVGRREETMKKESRNIAVHDGKEVHNEFSGCRDFMSYIKVSERRIIQL